MKWRNLYLLLTIFVLFCIPIEPFLLGAYNYIRIFYIIFFLIIFISKKKKSSKINKYDALMVLFVLFATVSNIYTGHSQSSTSMARELIINFLLAVGISYSILIASQGNQENKVINKLFYSFIVGTVLISLYLLIVELPQLGRWGRLGYDLYENYGSFMVYSYCCIISSCYILWDVFIKDNKETLDKRKKILKIIFLIIIFAGILASGTRKGILCPIIFLIISFYLKYKKRFLKLMFSFVIVCIFVLLGYKLIMTNEMFYNRIGVRIENMISSVFENSEEDGSINERELLRNLSIQAWKEHIVVGYGLHAFRYYSSTHGGPYLYSHCNYTEILADLGIIGFILYYTAYMYLIVICYKKRKNNMFYTLFLSFLLMNLISDYSTISYYRHYYLIFYFIIARYQSIYIPEESENKI